MAKSTKLMVALLLAVVAVGVHLYLTNHYFGLTFGLESGQSICNVSSKINCDTVTASKYSSIFGIPVALFGAVTNAVLGLLLLIWLAGWSSDPVRVARYATLLSAVTAITSIVMGSISTFMIGSYCLFCMSEYVLSFLIFGFAASSLEKSEKPWLAHIGELFGPAKAYLTFLVAIPAGAYFFNQVILNQIDARELPAVVTSVIADWQNGATMNLTQPPSFVEKSATADSNPKMVIAEFADFLCPHCKHASSPVKAFVNSHPDAELRFYSFPLDQECNAVMKGSEEGIRCYLARSVFCAEKVAKKGAIVHDQIFEMQEDFFANHSKAYTIEHVDGVLKNNAVDDASFKICINLPETDDAIRNQAKLGSDLGVHGTPTFFVNGKKLERGSLIPVLEAVHATLSK